MIVTVLINTLVTDYHSTGLLAVRIRAVVKGMCTAYLELQQFIHVFIMFRL